MCAILSSRDAFCVQFKVISISGIVIKVEIRCAVPVGGARVSVSLALGREQFEEEDRLSGVRVVWVSHSFKLSTALISTILILSSVF